jgi:pimeloyl-ACP methyl ester carboxylesterase
MPDRRSSTDLQNGAAAAVYADAGGTGADPRFVLVAPFVRDGRMSFVQRMLRTSCGCLGWHIRCICRTSRNGSPRSPRTSPSTRRSLRPTLKEPDRRGVISAYLLQQSHAEAEARLDKVTAPVLIIMGTGDVDWPDPAAEARWIGDRLSGEVLVLEGAGHHPHVEQPEEIAEAVIAFARKLDQPQDLDA